MSSAKNNPKTAALLVGFGGPTKPEEVWPFLQSVVEGTRIPEERLRAVEQHYLAFGGISPFNQITHRQKVALEAYFKSKGIEVPVAVAYRHSTPSFKDSFEQLHRFGVQRVIAFILASFRSFSSFEKYHERLNLSREQANAANIEIIYTGAFDQEPLYVEALKSRVDEIWGVWSEKEKAKTYTIFTAHSIPSTICESSTASNEGRCYGFQFYELAKHLAQAMSMKKNWGIAYQSRSGNPRDPWLDPDVLEMIEKIDKQKFKRLLLIPLGFLCDNVEVLFDLDSQAKEHCVKLGLGYFRASTVSDHPKFIELMAKKILEKM